MRNVRSLLGVVFAGVMISACNLHENETQPLDSSDASYPLDPSQLYYVSLSPNKYAEGLLNEKTQPAPTMQELNLIKQAGAIPLPEAGIMLLKRVGHCYQSKTIVKNEAGSPSFVSFEHIKGPYYLKASSDDGCYEQGRGGEHSVEIVYIIGDRVKSAQFRAPEGSSVKVPKFSEWIHKQGDTKKWWLNAKSRPNPEANKKAGAFSLEEKYLVTVSDTKAYRAYFDEFEHYLAVDHDMFYSGGDLTQPQKLVLSYKENREKAKQRRERMLAQQKIIQERQRKQAAQATRPAQPRYQPQQPSQRQQRNYNATTGIDSLDIGDGVYVQGFFSDELALVVRINRNNNTVKVRRSLDGTTKWVPYRDIISREQTYVNDAARVVGGVALFVCILSPDSCKAKQ